MAECKHIKATVALGILSGRKQGTTATALDLVVCSAVARATAAAIIACAAQLQPAPGREGGAL